METLDCLALEITQDGDIFGYRVIRITEVNAVVVKELLAEAAGFNSYPAAEAVGMKIFTHQYTHIALQRSQSSESFVDYRSRFRLPELLDEAMKVRVSH